jgi:2-amino-4-hydroxy-6-hydroxymethyldihydropteridine diphosphokinase
MAQTRGIDLVAASAVSRTAPVDNRDQPDFLNQVVTIKTRLPPRRLLAALQSIEDRLGRVRSTWKGPRTIDLDILLYGDRIIEERGLAVPHPALLRRDFLIRQILEIDPRAVDPVSRRPLSSFLPGRVARGGAPSAENIDGNERSIGTAAAAHPGRLHGDEGAGGEDRRPDGV